MGRGRAKAKQIKVARKLKYSTPETDLTALERELRRGRDNRFDGPPPDDGGDDDDPYAAYAVDDEDDDSWSSDGRS